MTANGREQRADSFKRDLLLWVSLHHFLPAPLLEELAAVVVKTASGGRLQLDNLFKSRISGGPSHLASWERAAAEIEPTAFGGYLGRVVDLIAEQNDSAAWIDMEKLDERDRDIARGLTIAAELTAIDLSTFSTWYRRKDAFPPELKAFGSAFSKLADESDSDECADVEAALADLPMPIRALALKHFGDLCADIDNPRLGLVFYERTTHLLTGFYDLCWQDLIPAVSDGLVLSHAALLRTLKGAQAAAELLLPALRSRDVEHAPLLHINGWRDAANAQIQASDTFQFPTFKAAEVVMPPLLTENLTLGGAFASWVRKEYEPASRRFWAVLRRQVAQGAATESRLTKAYFARCIFDQLSETAGQQHRPESFMLAVRLLLESGEAEIASTASWKEDFLQAYLDTPTVAACIHHARKHAGARLERSRVLIALFQGWLTGLPRTADAVAEDMLTHLATEAGEGTSSIISGRDLSQTGFKAIEGVGRERPEFRSLANEPIVRAIKEKLRDGTFHEKWHALDAAAVFADGVNPAYLQLMIRMVVELLETLDPSSNVWPLVRPSIGLISSPQARTVWLSDSELASRCADMLLTFGLRDSSENARLMFLLSDLQGYLKPRPEDRELLAEVVGNLRRRAQKINSSEVTSAILGLLAAPVLAGEEGVADALEGLSSILKTASSDRRSIGLPYAYQCLNYLAIRHSVIERDLGVSETWMKDRIEPVKSQLAAVWKGAAADPLMFTQFAIPAHTVPDKLLVQNWAFVTYGFIGAFGSSPSLDEALLKASQSPLLVESMASGRVMRFDEELFVAGSLESEPAQAFYAAIGKRLSVLAQQERPDRDLLETMVIQCLKHGPDARDAGVFALALREHMQINADQILREGYVASVSRSSDLQLGLLPLLQALKLVELN